MDEEKFNFYVKGNDEDSWKNLLADPDKQWRKNFSAMESYLSWKNGIPNEIQSILSSYFGKVELLFAFPEFKVELESGVRSSQNDIFTILRNDQEIITLTVEAKCKENFDKTIVEWSKDISFNSKKPDRIKFLCNKIKVNITDINDPKIENLRYQLFHRLASSVIMAEKMHTKSAVMLVQSFEKDDSINHFNDYVNFLRSLYGIDKVEKRKLYLLSKGNINIYSGWVESEKY